MILTGLFLAKIAAGALIGAAAVGILATFWKDFINFVNKALEKVQQLVAGTVYGFKVFVEKMKEGVKEISRHYSKVDQHWEETTVTRTISESEVPPEILARANVGIELDITDEMEMQLTNA